VNWSLLGCGRSGHITYAPDEPELREQLTASTAGGEAWRCLRCAAFVPGPPDGSGPAASAALVRRGKEIRSALILRIFAVERFLRGLVFGAFAVLLWRFEYARQSIEAAFDREWPILRDLFRQLGFDIDHSKLVGLIQHAMTLSSRTILLLAVGVTAYVVVEFVEGVGLWLTKRWGEYFAMIATSFGLPLEIYDLTRKVTVTAALFLVVNLALVLYLVLTKRLFGARGGKHAYEASLRSQSVMELAAEAVATARDRGLAAAAEAAVLHDHAHNSPAPLPHSASPAQPVAPSGRPTGLGEPVGGGEPVGAGETVAAAGVYAADESALAGEAAPAADGRAEL
jgi:uncharacterized membrane protein (DUF2068 family)